MMSGLNRENIKRVKFFQFLIGLFYAIFYEYVYRVYMFPTWEYLGAEYNELSQYQYCAFVICGAIPLLYYNGFKTLASGISLVEYILVYMPLLLAVMVTKSMRTFEGSLIFIELFVVQIIFFKTDCVVLFNSFWRKPYKYIPFQILELVTVILIIFLIIDNRHGLHFVNFFQHQDEMYELRADYSQTRGILSGYILNWVGKGFLPILLVRYLCKNQKGKITLAIVGYFIVYMLDMQKITLVMPFVMILFYILVTKLKNIQLYFPFIFISLLIVIPCILLHTLNNPIAYTLSSILIMRTQCVSGWLGSIYFNFFQAECHPFTYYTHIGIIKWITGAYPYGEKSLGVAVSEGAMNANANFMLTDGYAAGGILGILIVAIVFIIIKSILNGTGSRYNPQVLFVGFLPAISAMMNVSIFTSVLSSGLLIIYLILLKFKLT